MDDSIDGVVRKYFTQQSKMYGSTLYLSDSRSILEMMGQMRTHQMEELRRSTPQEHGPTTIPMNFIGTSLEEFESAICQCQKCPLGSARTKFVFGVGSPEAKLVFVGEGPGREEDLQGEPFVGPAGKLLDKILHAIHMSRQEVYICNVVKCRPPNNRVPHPDEIATCFPYLEMQLKMINPKLIVALGATAAHALLAVKIPLGQLRSKVWKWQKYDVVVSYHPAALLRNPNLKRPAWEDFQWIQQLLVKN